MKHTLLGSVTDLKQHHAGKHVIVGSHCGLFTGIFALRIGVASLIGHDAGVGREESGIRGLALLDQHHISAAAASFTSSRIGDPEDILARGKISHVNASAQALGIFAGQSVNAAAEALRQSVKCEPLKQISQSTAAIESREILQSSEPPLNTKIRVVIMDSASLIRAEDVGAVVVTGSHGGLPGANPNSAIKANVLCAVFNDAGVGIDQAGIARIYVLDNRGIAAVTVNAFSACIGNGRSSYETGVISHVNQAAEQLGAKISMPVRQFIQQLINRD